MLTKSDLIQKIDTDLIWRRRELSNFKTTLENENIPLSQKPGLLRAGVALLYAHWEGFVKLSGSYYLEFVIDQRLSANKLKSNFLAIKMKSMLNEANKSKKISSSSNLIDYFRKNLNTRLRLTHKGIVDTQGNLSSKVFEEILWVLGLEVSQYKTKFNLIDSSLVNRRNHVAHGESMDIDFDDFIELYDETMLLIEQFRTQLQNSAILEEYLRK